jgi:hypothetical protein
VETNVQKRMANGKVVSRFGFLNYSDYIIVQKYQAEYRGLVNYYLMARNVKALGRYHRVMQISLLKTLANKHKTSVKMMVKKHRATKDTPSGPMTVYRVIVPRGEGKDPLVAEFGGIPLRKQEVKALRDTPYFVGANRSDPVVRLLKQRCEMCGRKAEELTHLGPELGRIEAHHIRRLANIRPKGRRELPEWKKRMIAMRRKTLIVCVECHDNIHAGRPCRAPMEDSILDAVSGEPDDAKVSRPVRRGADGKRSMSNLASGLPYTTALALALKGGQNGGPVGVWWA